MSTITLPFSPAHEITSADNLKETDLYKKLPDEFRKAVDEYPHLLEYLHIFPIEEKGMPEYYPELTRKLGDIKHPNLIYPTAKKGIFVHVLDNPQDYRNSYIPIEPTLVTNVDDLVAEVENRLLELRSHLPVVDENTTREDEMIQYLEKVTTIDDEKPQTGLLNILKTYFFNDGSNVKKLKVTKRQLEAIKYLFLREKVGLGDIDVLITDPHIEDISCSGTGQVFVEHKVFKGIKSAVTFTSSIELDNFVMWLSEQIRKPVTYKNPICDATLPDGSRINIVYGRDISKRGSNFTIRDRKSVV